MSQALSGHGCFQAYLTERTRAQSPSCMHCTAAYNDAELTIFLCPFWNESRAELTRSLGRPPRPEDVADLMCGPRQEDLPTEGRHQVRLLAAEKRNSSLFAAMIESIMGQKEALE
ncbi:uncharacterized protein LOC115033589 [Acyrthosiphon pisum]|uniref:Uncharacterized protein n=1 Tax=Acyrthosiphon pisum TaxID=7029 RepID=A0A8R2NKS4_ACYPI|nr:uncharacterized protein LOC115033589 [Acyrthosiphon pisum]